MAKIRDYNVQSSPRGSGAGPRASTAAFGGGVGESVQRLGSSMIEAGGAYQRAKENSELSDLSAKISEKQVQFTTKWDEVVRTGHNDPKFHEKFMEEYDSEVSKISEGIETDKGREFFQKSNTELRFQFQKQAAKAQAEMAGARTKSNYIQLQNNLSSSLISNPGAFEQNLSLHDSAVENMVTGGLLPFDKAEQLKLEGRRELAKSAAKGMIKLNPSQAKSAINSEKWNQFLDGGDKFTLLEEADQEIRAREVEKERNKSVVEKAKRERQKAVQAEFQEKIFNNQLTGKEVMDSDLPAFGSGSKEQFIKLLKRQANDEADIDASDPVIYNQVFDRIHADPNDPDAITDENDINDLVFDGLSQEDANFLIKEIKTKKTQKTSIESKMKKKVVEEAAKKLSRTNLLSGYIDEGGEERVHQFAAFMREEYDKGMRNGKTAQDLLDPSSPNYLGKFTSSFVKSDKEIMSDLANEKRKKEKINGFNQKEKAAFDWANKNRKDPKAKLIFKRLGMGE